jgi:UDP-N-acetylmuramyl pentapeptide phosphotransferase/UDP-N-acetylglucosamine-1-phosphate transferase
VILPYVIGGVAGGVFAWAVVALWIRVSLRAKIVDVPNARSSHVRATPRGGGVGIVATVVVGVALVLAAERAEGIETAVWAGGLALFVAVFSFVDDVRSLPSLVRLVLQVGTAAVAVWKFGAFPAVTLPFLQPIVPPEWLMAVVTVVWIVGLTNVYNFMDGIDGIAGGQGLVAGLAWAWFGVVTGLPLVAWTAGMVAAACAGFLVHNWSPAKVFMGDVGSAFLGFVFALLPVLALHGRGVGSEWPIPIVGAVPVFAALVVWPFLGDGVFTFLRRVKHGENVLAAHRSHLYQRLNIAGWKHGPISRLYVWWAAAGALGGAMYLRSGHETRALVLAGCAASVAAMYVAVKRAERREDA